MRRACSRRARIQAEQRDRAGLEDTLDIMRGRSAARASGLAHSYAFAAELYERMGDHGAALHAFEEANRTEPTRERLRAVAQAASRFGDLSRALRAFTELCSQSAPGSEDCAARDAVRKRFRQP